MSVAPVKNDSYLTVCRICNGKWVYWHVKADILVHCSKIVFLVISSAAVEKNNVTDCYFACILLAGNLSTLKPHGSRVWFGGFIVALCDVTS